jgi:spectinomycin phosphotransferase
VRDRPDALEDDDIRSALTAGWEIDTTSMRYVPLGGGSYHWQVQAADGCRWFVSATDLDHAPWLGATRSSSLRTLRATMDTASTLRQEVGLSFVLAPVPCNNGDTLRPVRQRYGLVVHPFLEGACGKFGAPLAQAETSTVIDIVAALHETPTSTVDLHQLVDLKARESLDQDDLPMGLILERYDELCGDLSDRHLVITHGEPHAGNVMRSGDDTYLIDWDTAALALPERDLWLLYDHGNTDVLRLYEDRTGHTVDPAALAFYRLRFAVEELIGAVGDLDASSTRQAIDNARAAAGL